MIETMLKNQYLILLKRFWKYILAGVVVIFIISFFLLKGDKGSTEILTVKAEQFNQTVTVSGESKADSFVDLAFDQSGKVSRVGPQVGDKVAAGDLLVALDSADARADLLSAQANLEYQQAKLSDAQVSLTDARQILEDDLRDAFTKADDAIRNHGDRVFADPNSASARFEISFTDGTKQVNFDLNNTNLKSRLGEDRQKIATLLSTWREDVNNPAFFADSDKAVAITQERLRVTRDFLDAISQAVNSLTTIYYQYRTTLDGYKTDIATARTNVDSANSDISGSKQALNSAKLNAGQFSLSQLSTQSAQIKQAEAEVAKQQAALSNLSLISPISGVVTKQEARVGEAVTAGKVVVSVINPNSFEVEANIPEINIGKIKIGQEAAVTFDAFPAEKFTGKVFYIEPAATIVDGVVNYKIKVAFSQSNAQIKSGLTTNLSINTLHKDKVLVVPVYALSTEAGVTTVLKSVNGQAIKTKIELGAYGDGGLVEVINGLSEGDKIIATKK